MNRHRKEPNWANRSRSAGSSSGGRAGGKRRARRDTEPYGPVEGPAMTKEQWRRYHEGPKPSEEDIRRIIGRSAPGKKEGYTARELGLKPGDWDDPRYRMAYNYFVILREDTDDDRDRGTRSSSANADEEIVFISPGNHSVSALIMFLDRFDGKGLEVKQAYDRTHGYAVVAVSAKMRRLLAHKGFVVETFELGPFSAPV